MVQVTCDRCRNLVEDFAAAKITKKVPAQKIKLGGSRRSTTVSAYEVEVYICLDCVSKEKA